ncbi:hypothetical protein WOLCODRAFT_15337 [Wolfiporia cocos MD-104 SS10]|uniref:Uncharacterized protein n=1 Tax=Wolfiporia cocos (strain MD-104) TaxID=742152 RepID=A0A2H3JEQ4_WOLCO|nr:hypothetical protein WOLCODRAFT_15337 [Wolfiporia cocos MD-104 SS10]
MDSVDQPVVDLQRQDGEIIVLQNSYPHPRRNQLLGKSTDVAPIRFLVRDQEDSPARHASLWELVNRLHDLEGFLENGQGMTPFASSEQGFRTAIQFNIDWPGYPTWLSESSISSGHCSIKADLCRIVLSACTRFVHAMASHSPDVRLGGIWTLGLVRDMKPGDNIFTAKDLHLFHPL